MSMIGWLLTILVVGFFAIIAIKLVPVYINRLTVGSVMDSLKNEPNVYSMSQAEVASLIVKRLEGNLIKDIGADSIYVSDANNIRLIELDYEVRRNLFGNHDIVISFLSSVEVTGR